jgi:putative transposase
MHGARSITASAVVRVLHRLRAPRGTPKDVKRDNGAECMAERVTGWRSERGMHTRFTGPGSPWQDGHNERFNAVLRDACLDRWRFASVQEARRIIQQWREEYNHERPHGARNGMTPAALAAQPASQRGRAA